MIVKISLKTKITALYEGHDCPSVCAYNFVSAPKSLKMFRLHSTKKIFAKFLYSNYNSKGGTE